MFPTPVWCEYGVVPRGMRPRLKEFAYPPGDSFAYGPLAVDLQGSAVVLLERALWDRRTFARNENTHASSHASSAIVLAVTAFDIWLAELIVGLMLTEDETRSRLDLPTASKYRALYEKYHGKLAPDISDLITVVSPSPRDRSPFSAAGCECHPGMAASAATARSPRHASLRARGGLFSNSETRIVCTSPLGVRGLGGGGNGPHRGSRQSAGADSLERHL
jgi:hypothetical protein